MTKGFFQGNRERLYAQMKDSSQGNNCLATENGCENLSVAASRTVEAIEDTMRRGFVAVS